MSMIPNTGGLAIGSGIDYEALLAEGSPGIYLRATSDEWNAISAQLHLGHHRQPEGVVSPSPRRLPQCDVEHRELGHGAAFDLSVDATDVSTATAGASRGPWPPTRVPTYACVA